MHPPPFLPVRAVIAVQFGRKQEKTATKANFDLQSKSLEEAGSDMLYVLLLLFVFVNALAALGLPYYCDFILAVSIDVKIVESWKCFSVDDEAALCNGGVPVGFGVTSCDSNGEPSGLDLSHSNLKGIAAGN